MPKKIAVCGLGPTGIGVVLGLDELAETKQLQPEEFPEIHLFDSAKTIGGTPYSASVADPEHILNGPVEHLPQEFKSWVNLMPQDETTSNRQKIENYFKQIFENRLSKKLGFAYDADKRGQYDAKQKAICESYDLIWQSFKKHHISALEPEDLEQNAVPNYYSRMLLGMFMSDIFERAVANLERKGFKVIRHMESEITAMKKPPERQFIKVPSRQLILQFNGEELKVDHVFLCSGGLKNIALPQSNRYLPNIWPIADLKKQVDEISATTLQKNQKAEITIAIEGKGLSAIDVVKSLLQTGQFQDQPDGSMVFAPDQSSPYKIKIVMLSRSAVFHNVQSGENWSQSEIFQQSDGSFKYPQGTEISQTTFEDLAKDQQNQFRLWQFATIITRAIELTYKRLEEYNQINDHSKSNAARDFLYHIIYHVKKDRPEIDRMEFDQFLDGLSGDAKSQMQELQQHFGLQLDGANYQEIGNRFNQIIGFAETVDCWQKLRQDLQYAKQGDINGNQLWRHFVMMPPHALLPKEESIYCGNFFGRHIETLNGIPPVTARQLLALHEAQILEMATMGREMKKCYLTASGEKIASQDRISKNQQQSDWQDDKVIFQGENGQELACDIAINAKSSYGNEFEPSPLVKSLRDHGILKSMTSKSIHCDSDFEYDNKQQEMAASFGNEATALITKSLNLVRENDGKWYCQNTSFMRFKNNKPLDEKGHPTVENLQIVMPSNITFSITNGKKVARDLIETSKTIEPLASQQFYQKPVNKLQK